MQSLPDRLLCASTYASCFIPYCDILFMVQVCRLMGRSLGERRHRPGCKGKPAWIRCSLPDNQLLHGGGKGLGREHQALAYVPHGKAVRDSRHDGLQREAFRLKIERQQGYQDLLRSQQGLRCTAKRPLPMTWPSPTLCFGYMRVL